MQKYLSRFLHSLEEQPFQLLPFSLAFLGLIFTRLAIEGSIGSFQSHQASFFYYEFSHTFFFFTFSFLLFLPVLSFLAKTPLARTANILLFGFLIILTPPLIDKLIFGQEAFWSFYEFDGPQGLLLRYFTLFGETPQIGITYGVRIEVVLVSLGSALYALWKTKSWLRGLATAITLYTILFVLGTFPSWIAFLLELPHQSPLSVTRLDVASWFLTPERILGRDLPEMRSVLNMKMSLFYGVLVLLAGFLLMKKAVPQHVAALWKNARLPQVIYHCGLVSLGALLAIIFEGLSLRFTAFEAVAFLLLLAASISAWLSSVIVNDLNDIKIDRLTNATRPLIVGAIEEKTYAAYGFLFFLASILLAGLASFHAFFLFFLYQAVAWIYSVPPFRLKRFPVVATLLASFAGFLVLASGYLAISEAGSLAALPTSLIFYLIISYAFILPLKDFKDIAGDRSDNVFTIPVLLGEKKAKLLIGSGLFLAFTLSPLILNVPSLFPLAFLFGSGAFWLLQKAGPAKGHLLSYYRLPAALIGLTGTYGFLLLLFLLS